MKRVLAGVGVMAVSVCAWLSAAAQEAQPQDGRPVLRMAYFIPADREPEPDRQARLDRVMTEVQRFYKEGMAQNGYAGMGFELDRDGTGALRIFEVRGKLPMRGYGRNDSAKVRQEVKDVLAGQGLDIDREVVVIFQLLLEWQDGKATELGPFVGGRGAWPGYGTAWVYDDEKLDAALLPSKEPGGYYHAPCTLGQFNTHYIGGVAHELGHAFGLPHDCQSEADYAVKGASLMGSGNHVYGKNLRGEGKGAFLSAASALPLSLHPLFTGKRVKATPATSRLTALEAAFAEGTLTLAGRLEGGDAVKGVVALNLLLDKPGDYHSVGWTCPVAPDGRFRLAVRELKPGNYGLFLRAFTATGVFKTFEFRYAVDGQGIPDLAPFRGVILLLGAQDAFKAEDKALLRRIAAEAGKVLPAGSKVLAKLTHLDKLLSESAPVVLADVRANTVLLGDVAYESASVGWGEPLRNQVLAGENSLQIEIGERFYSSGLFAHAPSSYVYALDGKWTRFTAECGLQNGHYGSVVFVVKGDSKELYRSGVDRGLITKSLQLSVKGVRRLELITEDAGDGNGGDWGVWIEPRLLR